MINPWSDRWQWVKTYIPNNISIVDFGCGNREVLEHIQPSQYLGIDLVSTADVMADIDTPLQFDQRFDLALLLGVLEYVYDPDEVMRNVVKAADKCLVLTLDSKIKPQWQRTYNQQSVLDLLQRFFGRVDQHRHGRYIVSQCEK